MSLEGRDPEDDPSWASVSSSGHQEGLSEPWTQTMFPGVLHLPEAPQGLLQGLLQRGLSRGHLKFVTNWVGSFQGSPTV